jgi:hypothetical protein
LALGFWLSVAAARCDREPLFFAADDSRPIENRTFSIQSAIFVRLILSTHTTQAHPRAEDEYLHA